MSKITRPAAQIRAFFNLTRALPDRFTRSRVWSPRSVMTWLMLLCLPDRKTSYRRSLTGLTYYGRRLFGWTKIPTLASISKARRNLTIAMCREYLHELVAQCESLMTTPKTPWGRRRFIAFDGSRTVLPRTVDTARKMARPKRPNGTHVHNPQGLLVAAVDVFRRLPLDWSFTGKGVGERTAMQELVSRLPWQPGDVAIMDRGFPSRKLFGALIAQGVDIIARISASDAIAWKELKPFLKSKKKNADIEITVVGADGPVTVRAKVVERDRQPGRPRKGTKKERMVILTTLSEDDGFDRKSLIKIYGARWGIETLFGEMKSFMQVEDFHSGFVDGCEQEIVAAMIWMALASFLQAEAERTLGGRRVVRADCLRVASDLVSDLIRGRDIDKQLQHDIMALRQFAYTPQPDRHYPRECKRPFGRSVQRGGAK